MNRGVTLVGAAGLGAGLMYFLDPVLGRRRRGLVRDRVITAMARADGLISKTGRDLAHRAAGFAAEASAVVRGRERVSDEVLAQRVRAKIGRYCSHASSLGVSVRRGQVILDGPILAAEVEDVLRAAAAVPGVGNVENRLTVHQRAGNVSGLQGQGRRPMERFDLMQAHWAPATRLLAGTVGCGLMANCLARRTLPAALLGTGGFGLFLRGLTNLPMAQLLGLSGGGGGIPFLKTINIAAPVERVFALWSDFQNFPHCMRHVRAVRDLGGGRSRWTVEGPAGTQVSWDAVVKRRIPNRELAWESVPGSRVCHTGVVQFQPNGDGGTRVQVRLSYIPPAGVFGHAVAALFGADPKRDMDDDLMRMKTFIETGIPPHDAAEADGRHRKTTHRMRSPTMQGEPMGEGSAGI
jgi:uncharacterized membrane protein